MLGASRVFRGHSDVVEDVAWHRHNKELFGSCGDDRMVAVWDVRAESATTPSLYNMLHTGDGMALCFNPFNEHLLLSGATDNTIDRLLPAA